MVKMMALKEVVLYFENFNLREILESSVLERNAFLPSKTIKADKKYLLQAKCKTTAYKICFTKNVFWYILLKIRINYK